MLIEFSKLKGLSVGVMDEAKKVGEVSRVVFDHTQAKVIGLLVKAGGLMSREMVVSLADVVSIDVGGVVINSSDDILDKDEIVRVNTILKKNTKLVGLRVYDKENKFLGFVYDGVLETDTGNLMRLYVRYLWRRYIFSSKQIVELNEKRVVVNTDAKIKKTAKVVSVAEAV